MSSRPPTTGILGGSGSRQSQVALEPHFLNGIIRFQSVLSAHGYFTMLLGGAALALLGHLRKTKDLDFNVRPKEGPYDIGQALEIQDLRNDCNKQAIFLRPDLKRPNRWSAKIRLDSFKIGVDVALRPEVKWLAEMGYVKNVHGAFCADERFLIANKIKSMTERNDPRKRDKDFADIMFCLRRLTEAEEIDRLSPELLLKVIAESESQLQPEEKWDKVWRAFWTHALKEEEEDILQLQKYFPELGLPGFGATTFPPDTKLHR